MQEGVEFKHFPDSFAKLRNFVHCDIEFIPKYLVFNEASEGISSIQRITIKNTGTKPAFIKIYQPSSIVFQVKTMKRGVMLNPGLSISTTVTYNFKRPSFLRATIPVEVNGKIIDYPVVCKLLVEGISIDPHSVDFGFVDIGYSSGVKVITLKNEGGKSTRFAIDLGTNDLEITVKPMRGIVKPYKPVHLTVELIGMHEGVYFSEFWIKSVPNIRVPFKVNVIIPRLVIYHPNATGDFTLLDFSTVVANTRHYDSFVLRNLSSQVASYVVLGEVDNEVKCIRVIKGIFTARKLTLTKEINRKKYPVYSAFDIRPIQGRIGPFEGIIFEAGFTPAISLMNPRKELKDKMDKGENDFMAFLRIVRVHVTETQDFSRDDLAIMESVSSSASSQSSMESVVSDVVRLCLHGEVAEGRLKFEPDVLHFGEIKVGEDSQRVVRISNPLKFAPLYWRYLQRTSVRCFPQSMTLKPEGTLDVLLIVTGRESVNSTFKVYFDVEADSSESPISRHKTKIKVGSYSVQCTVAVKLLTTTKQSCQPIAQSVFGRDYTDVPVVPKKPRKIWAPRSLQIMSKDAVKIHKDLDEKIEKKLVRTSRLEYKNLSDRVSCDIIKKKKFPNLKTSTEVLIPLTPLQIYNVRMYPTLFSFGMVVPRSRNYRQLIVENLNEFPIMIRLTNLSSCVTFPQGNLMILPPGSLVKRLVEFRANHFGKFNGYIDYVINDNHSFGLAVIANIVEKQLSLDSREIVFGTDWSKEEIYQPMDCAIRIRNKLGAKTNFRWELPDTCCFFVEPIAGVVRGNSSLYTYICYKPDYRRTSCSELTMKCENNSYLSVKLHMPTHFPKVGFLKDIIDIGEIPLNLPSKTTALLRNFEYFEVEFLVDSSSLVHGCIVEPPHGVLPPRGIAKFEICLTFNFCFRFATIIHVLVQKMGLLQLKIMGTVSFPEFRLFPRSINLRRISASTYQHYLITATNAGTTTLKLHFLLEEYPEFRISRSSHKEGPDIGREGIFLAPGTNQVFHLHFLPTNLVSFVFYLPIVINDILGPALISNSKSLKPLEYVKQFRDIYAQLHNFTMLDIPLKFATLSIDCTVARHAIFFNKLTFHFDVFSNNVSEKFSIENRECANEKSILIDISAFSDANCPFSIRWSHGTKPNITSDCIQCTLKEGQQSSFILHFQPKTRGNFSLDAPIFIRDELDGEMFNELCITGVYHVQTIHSEYSEIYFEPSPLNAVTEKTFRLSTNYFESDAHIQWKIMTPDRYSGTYNEDVLRINFVDTNIAPALKHTEMAVKVVFVSKVPVSFRTNVEFSDNTGLIICPVRIYATADNSLLTLYAIIRNRTSFSEWSKLNDKRMSHISRISGSFSEEEDDSIYSPRSMQMSTAKVSAMSYFGRRSRTSFERLADHRIKVPTGIREYAQEADQFSNDSEDDVKMPVAETLDLKSDTSMATFKKEFESVQYPFFPFGNESDEFEIYMNQTLEAAKEWLYIDPFKFNYYPEIPNGITASLQEFFSRKQLQYKSTSRSQSGRCIVDILESLLGPQIYDHIVLPKTLPEKDIDRANCMYNLYDSILSFLLKNGAHLSHVCAQFLLTYEDYDLFTLNTRCKSTTRKAHEVFPVQKKLSQINFMSRSKQCWLDIMLQIYKCFVLSSITAIQSTTELISTNRRSTVHRASVVSSIISLRKHYDSHDEDVKNIQAETLPSNTYSPNEMFLLGWLEYHYEEQRTMDWMSERQLVLNPNGANDIADERQIRNFDTDLCDSLVLIAVTAAYCSFLIEESFSNFYVCPRSYEEVLHNAVCVVNAWRKIRLGFVITPMEIVYPNCVKMLMLVAYLFYVLPTYVPRTRVKFSCPLSETVIRQINFANPTSYSVGFLIMFFGNSNGFFRAVTPQSIIRLSGHKSTVVNIEYYARKIKGTRAYLLFCGSTIGPYFGRNQAFILEGQADNLAISSEYTIYSGLYQAIDKTLVINVPYQNSAEYEIWMSEQRPSQPRTLRQTRWSELCLRKIPRSLFLNQKTIVVNEDNKEANLSVTVACITPANRSFWIIFQSNIGDFIIQINSHWQASLTDNIVVKWEEQVEKCICTEAGYTEICPLSLSAPIPSRNKQLWSCVAHMFQKTLNPKERMFWSRYLDTHIGLRLIRWLMGDSADAAAKEFIHIFESTVKYNVTIAETSDILSIPKTFTINDVRPPTENVPMKIHISPSTQQLVQILLTLTSVGNKERRTYMVSFLRV